VHPFAALADPTRREIIELLSERDHLAGELAERFPVSGPAISKHLRVLREAGLCTYRQHAQQRIYQLQPDALAEADQWMQQRLDLWRARFDALGRQLESMREEEENDHGGRRARR
jgi:DNA-binding transcriptional ArsR family regulator